MKYFNRKVVAAGTILAAVSLLSVHYMPHASAKDIESLLPMSRVSIPAPLSYEGDKRTLPTVVGDMNAAINAGQDGLSASATLIDLQSGTTYNAGASTTIFKAASTAKVLTAVDYLHEVEEGHATLDQDIDGDTAQHLMQRMIVVSDNDAWADLNDLLGDQQQAYATSIGMTHFTGGDYNTMTTDDEATLLAKLYEGKLISASDRSLLYSYMENTDSTNLIQAALPSGATVYHKYGQLWGYLNDAAIVSYQGHDFVLVIFTNNSDGTTDEYEDQVSLIHSITQEVFKDITAS